MGRYYNGDIEGKFWFGVQTSDDACFFGAEETTINTYYIERDDLPEVSKRLEECKKKLGIYKDKLDKFFNDNDSYNDSDLAKEFNIDVKKLSELLEWYARFELGEKIALHLISNEDCEFTADY